MGRFTDFFKALATNADVMDDKYIEKELQEFMSENSDSAKRVSDLEKRLHVDVRKRATRSKPVQDTNETQVKSIKKSRTQAQAQTQDQAQNQAQPQPQVEKGERE